jgi:hypothetical protein
MKKIKLNEESYKKLLNEISYGTVDRAYDKSDEIFYYLITPFDDFYTNLESALHDTDGNPYLVKIKEYADSILTILNKKRNQQEKFYNATKSVNSNDFYNSEDGKENGIEDFDLGYLQNKYPN